MSTPTSRLRLLTVLLLASMGAGLAPAAAPPLAGVFPDAAGWKKDGGPELYTPASLYNYIDGAAELYLQYNFRELAVQNYANAKKHDLSVEVYRHASPVDAFGIYSQEKPSAGEFLAVGAEGYVEDMLLNFTTGDCYVKMNIFGAGPEGRSLLQQFARALVARIPGPAALPRELGCFPAERRVAHSERYTARNFLGYEYLHSAFSAEYAAAGQPCKAFLITAKDAAEAGEMVRRLAYGGKEQPAGLKEGKHTFRDKYLGDILLVWQGRRIRGAIGGDAAQRQGLADSIGAALKKLPPAK